MGAKVLVADDSRIMRKIIIRSLQSLCLSDIIEAADGDKACELFAQHQFDLVLSDWTMPGRTGLQVLEHIRNLGSKVPVILVIAERERDCVEQSVQSGLTDYIVKPFEASMLHRKLETLLTAAAH